MNISKFKRISVVVVCEEYLTAKKINRAMFHPNTLALPFSDII